MDNHHGLRTTATSSIGKRALERTSGARNASGEADLRPDEPIAGGVERSYDSTVTECGGLVAENARLRREATLWRRQACEAARAREEMLAILGDELRTPLAAMVLSLTRMKTRAEGQSRLFETLGRQTDRLTALINELLEGSRASTGHALIDRQRVEVYDVVTAALAEVTPGHTLSAPNILLHVPRQGLSVSGDPRLLRRALSHVLGNCFKFAGPDRPVNIRISAFADRDEALIRVADDGSGVSPDRLSSIFDPFLQGFPPETRPARGLGLGLTIVRRLVELHGGRVDAISAGSGCGLEIQIRLPINACHRSAASQHDD